MRRGLSRIRLGSPIIALESHRNRRETHHLPESRQASIAVPGQAMMNAPQPSAPRVSVISIFYNASAFLAEAIDSVLGQRFSGFELLLVDDGSTDGSSAMAQAYAARDPLHIRYLQHADHANRGMSATRNLGLLHARGEFVAFIDADDRWKPAKLAEQVELLDRLPEVDAVCGTVRYWSSWEGGRDRIVPTGHVRNLPVPPPQASLALYPLGGAAAPCPSDLMFRREALVDVGCFEESFTGPLQMYEDQALLAKLYLSKTIYFDDRQWLDYRVHDASCVSGVRREGRYGEVRRNFLEWFATYLAQTNDDRAVTVKAAVNRALRAQRYPSIREMFRRGLRKVRQA